MESLYWRTNIKYSIPALYVTSCTFGGPNLTDLYVTTTRTRMTDDELKQYPHAGGIFRIQTNVKGCPPIHFVMKILEVTQYEPYRLHKTRRKEYHDLCYEQYKLFETGSWLQAG